jgi:hypothetical protein
MPGFHLFSVISLCEMKPETFQTRLERSTVALFAAVALTSWASYSHLRALVLHTPHHGRLWFLDFSLFFPFHPQAATWLNVLLEIYWIWLVILACRYAVGMGRLFVLGYMSGMFLSQLQSMAPVAAAPLQCLKLVGSLTALSAAIVLLWRRNRSVPSLAGSATAVDE